MGNRLSKIYTRTGDDGTTGLGDGSRVRKDSLRVEAYGTVDELNSAIGVLLAVPAPCPPASSACLTEVQHELFDMGGELCIPGHTAISARACHARWSTCWTGSTTTLPPLKEFILPGGGTRPRPPATWRAPWRGAPSGACGRWPQRKPVSPQLPNYLNRLSDLLFVMARALARHEHGTEVLWRHERGRNLS